MQLHEEEAEEQQNLVQRLREELDTAREDTGVIQGEVKKLQDMREQLERHVNEARQQQEMSAEQVSELWKGLQVDV